MNLHVMDSTMQWAKNRIYSQGAHLVVLQYYVKKCINVYCSIKRYDCDRIVGIELVYGSFTALYIFLCLFTLIAQKILMIT